MKRIFLVLAVAALMAAMMVVMAAPAMAKGTVQIRPFQDIQVVSTDSPLREPNVVTRDFPIDPIYPPDPISPLREHNPNVVSD